jgi:general secretion pathway protein G
MTTLNAQSMNVTPRPVREMRAGRGRAFLLSRASGFTLLELIITLGVLAIVVSASIPYMKNSVKREREMTLRRNLRIIRKAIDTYYIDCEFRKLISPLDRREGDMCYPPTLDILVEGIHPVNQDRTIRYLRRLPVDPMTGKAEWKIEALQDDAGSSIGGKNVFDVHSMSEAQALNGTYYKNW